MTHLCHRVGMGGKLRPDRATQDRFSPFPAGEVALR